MDPSVIWGAAMVADPALCAPSVRHTRTSSFLPVLETLFVEYFTSYDGAQIAYRVSGDPASATLLCLAGGPGRDAAYLEDLGGLGVRHRLIVPDSRGTGRTPPTDDPLGYSFPRLAEDVEGLRRSLGLDRFSLLAHDAAVATAQAYVASYPERLTHLVLVCPDPWLQGGLPIDAHEIFLARYAEPWWQDVNDVLKDAETSSDLNQIRRLLPRIAPMAYGQWNARQREHAAFESLQLHPVPCAAFWQGVDNATRQAVLERLRLVRCPVLVITADRDAVTGLRAGELVADCFRNARLRVLHRVGHFPWVDQPGLFRSLVEEFLDQP